MAGRLEVDILMVKDGSDVRVWVSRVIRQVWVGASSPETVAIVAN
jgi:hypothetical protein